MLKLDRRLAVAGGWFDAGWFKPRKDGPLITGSAEPGSGATGGVALTAVGTGVDAAPESAAFRATEA